MQLYAGSAAQFVQDTIQSQISRKIELAFREQYRRKPGQGEVRSWENSLARMSNVMQHARLNDKDVGVILEYQLPLSSKRLDCMFTGRDGDAAANAVIVELKQWDNVQPSNITDSVVTYVGGGLRDVLHPSVQAHQYAQYLQDCDTAFGEGGIALAACGYLHNMHRDDSPELFNDRHAVALTQAPIFTADDTEHLETFLADRVGKGDGQTVLASVLGSKYRASKKLLDHTAAMVEGQQEYVLLDEQLVVFNAVLDQAKRGFHDRQKVVILVKGGPGTGKSVIALNLAGRLAQMGYNAQHSTGSKAFTENIRRVVGSRAGAQFTYWNMYMQAESNAVDVLIMDEAHRLRATSTNRFTPASMRSGKSQIEELLHAAKVCVFFIDDLQIVRPEEVGSADLIRKSAAAIGAKFSEFELESQFRCGGSDGFINWIDTVLGIRETANEVWDTTESFTFDVIDSVQELERVIRAKNTEGNTARLSAGFCWKWSDPKPDGTLVNDVQVGDWSMPWNAKPDKGRLAANIPKSHFWASNPYGVNQVGCVYTAQGFEYDYFGVIFGRDLRYDPVAETWIGDPTQSQDVTVKRAGNDFLRNVKNTYRVLLTRGMKGCYVYFEDDATRDYFRSRMK